MRKLIHRNKGKDGLVTMVALVKPLKGKGEEYLGYCNYQHHRGIVLRDSVCEKRECEHYTKLYITRK